MWATAATATATTMLLAPTHLSGIWGWQQQQCSMNAPPIPSLRDVGHGCYGDDDNTGPSPFSGIWGQQQHQHRPISHNSHNNGTPSFHHVSLLVESIMSLYSCNRAVPCLVCRWWPNRLYFGLELGSIVSAMMMLNAPPLVEGCGVSLSSRLCIVIVFYQHHSHACTSSLLSPTYSYRTPVGVQESGRTPTGLRHISYWPITIQISYPSPTGVLLNSYWTDSKSLRIMRS
jgi:hypothetical protein